MSAAVDVLAVIREACDRDAVPYDVYVALDSLVAANARTVRAFESLGKAKGVIPNLEAHRECELALIAQKAALARVGGAL
jgi:hypothetical protein